MLFHRTMTAPERALTCELIASDVDLQEGIRPLSAPDDDILGLAMHHRYSRVPLRDDNPERKVEMTHVAIVDLAGRRVQERREITIDDLVAAETPLHQVIDLLRSRGFCFVLVHDAIRKILTRSDLNKLPVRVYLSTLFAHVEGMLADTIDASFPNDAWFPGLADARQPEVKQLHQGKTVEDFDTRLIDCTTLSDKARIIRKEPHLKQQLGLPSSNQVTRQLKLINSLRNRLYHGLAPLTEECDTLRDHLDHGQPLTKVRDVIWLSNVVSTMNAWIEVLATPDTEGSDDGA